MMNAASPTYLARHGVPLTKRDLAQHRLVYFSSNLSSRGAAWTRRLPDGRYERVPMTVGITVNGFDAYQAAAVAGMGLIQAPEPGMRHLIASGALVPVLPADIAPPAPVSLLYPARRQLAPRVRAMLDWLADVMRVEQANASSCDSRQPKHPELPVQDTNGDGAALRPDGQRSFPPPA